LGHSPARRPTVGAEREEQRLRDAAFRLARRRFLGEIDDAATTGPADLRGPNP
jgi:hypothetical protein